MLLKGLYLEEQLTTGSWQPARRYESLCGLPCGKRRQSILAVGSTSAQQQGGVAAEIGPEQPRARHQDTQQHIAESSVAEQFSENLQIVPVEPDLYYAVSALRYMTFHEKLWQSYTLPSLGIPRFAHSKFAEGTTFQRETSNFVDDFQKRLDGTAWGWSDVRVEPYAALLPLSLLQELAPDDNFSYPACVGGDGLDTAVIKGDDPPDDLAVVATVDINYAAAMPDQVLMTGTLPGEEEVQQKVAAGLPFRAYVSNFCVDPRLHRKGIGRKLFTATELLIKQEGVEHVYLHVVSDAEAAFMMYFSLGYAEVARETEQQAKMRCRPAIHLLHKDLSGRSKRMAQERQRFQRPIRLLG